MADRSISVAVRGEVQQFQAAMASASQSVRGFSGNVAQMARDNRQEMTTVGTAAAGAGLAIAAGLGMGVKAAIDWESAFAGVVKTVDATDAELAVLEQGLRDMALEIPATHEELARIAEAAGQLGIQKQNILGFTETIAALGVSTNLAGDEGASMLARFANITQMPQDQFENLGSAIVELGNNGASTEAEIAGMALRIAGAGTQIGLTEGEILGFANALSSVGVEVEAGGTAISRVFIEIDKAVREGGDKLDRFAEVAGMSADDFTQAYGTNAAGALVTFVEGLGRVSTEGGNVFGVLEDLELADIRVRDALLRAAGAGDLFRESIALGNESFAEATALSEEAAQRYETVASQIQIAKNALFELGITIGDVILPVLIPVIDGVRNLAEWFSNLPEPVQTAGVILAGVSATLLTIGGTALILVPRIVALVDAWRKLSAAMAASRAVTSLNAPLPPTAFGKPMGPLGGAGVAGKVGGAVAVVGAGFAVKEAVDAGMKLADDIGQGNQDLASKIADLMRAAERGDQDAAQRLADFRAAFIDNQGFFAQNVNFMGEEFIANRAWLTAIEMLEDGAPAVSEFSEAFRGGEGAVDNWSGSMTEASGATDDYRQSLEEAREAQRLLVEGMNVAFGEVGSAVQAIQAMNDAQAALNAVQEDGESTAADVAAAQFDYAASVFAAQEAIDGMSADALTATIDGLAQALGISQDEAMELLEALNLLDGKEVTSVITVQTRRQTFTSGSGETARGHGGGRAGGGAVFAGVPYRMGEGNLPELMATKSGMFVVPGDAGRVFSNAQSEAFLNALTRQGSGTTVQITQNWPQGERVENGTRRALSAAAFLRAAS